MAARRRCRHRRRRAAVPGTGVGPGAGDGRPARRTTARSNLEDVIPGRTAHRKLRPRALAAVAAGVIAGALAVTGCASQSPGARGQGAPPGASGVAASAAAAGTGLSPTTAQAAEANQNVDIGGALGGKPAPDFRLVNQFGQPMSLSQFRGKVVLLAFEDSQCTTVCPLTTNEMVEAKRLLGTAGDRVQLLGVDANPVATAVSDVLAYSRAHDMVNEWDFLTGTKAQ